MIEHDAPVELAVIGAGVSGLTLARDVVRAQPDWTVRVFEAEDRPGGTMRSDRMGGSVCEWGPNGFLTNVNDTLELSRELGLGNRMLSADPRSERRYLWVRGRLRELPTGPGAFLTGDLLTVRGRMRVLMEPFAPRASGNGEDTVQSFARRRIGREAASVLVDAMVSGVYGGDPSRLSLLSSFPKMAQMESEHGSLMRAMAARRKTARAKPGGKSGSPFGPGGTLTSFDDGLEVLIRTLADDLGERLTLGAGVESLSRGPDGFRLEYSLHGTREAIRARRVVVATPSHVGRGLLSDSWPELAACLGEIPYASLTVACLAYRRSQIAHSLDGFGFLVPRGQGLRILGSLWTGSIFPDHVEGDTVLLRSMIGGARDPEVTLLSEGRTVDLVHGELDRALGGIEGRPQDVRLFRWAKGIPQYVVGHQDRLGMIDAQLQENPGLHLVGNAYRGIGVNDCVREAREAARRITAYPESSRLQMETSRGEVVHMNAAQVIRTKRDGGELGEAELSFFLRGFLDGEVETYQMSAFLMAVCLRGMTSPETAILTRLMVETGSTLSFPDVPGRKVDKHSTGGVGDMISIPLAPLVAACGVAVPMISGRGLGHTGGTLDKLESIPGFRTGLSPAELARILGEVGYAMGGQTEDLAPADRRMYALRDVTATVESIPLIVSSILSKKVAEGIDALVLDVKCGRGAFMKTESDALELAGELTRVASHMGKDVVAFVTDMDAPLGNAIGNGLELATSVACLKGSGPSDVMALIEVLGSAMLCLGDAAASFDEARKKLDEARTSGRGLARFDALIRAQGGDASVLEAPADLTAGAVRVPVTAGGSGVVADLDPYALGLAVVDLGGGRSRAEDDIDPRVGVVLERTLGDRVQSGDTLAWVLAADEATGTRVARDRVEGAYRIGSPATQRPPLVRHMVTAEGHWRWEGPPTWDSHAPVRTRETSR